MKINYPAALLAALAAGAALAQQQPANQRYLSVISVHVHPDKDAAFIEHYKTGAGAKAIQHRLKSTPTARRWTLLKAVYAGDPAPEANYLIASASDGDLAEPDPAKMDELSRASTGMSQAEYMTKVRTMSSTVGQTLSHMHEITDGYALTEGNYVVLRRLKIADGKLNEVGAMAHDIRLPLYSERVKAGGTIKGWSFSHLTFPGGASLPYNASEVTIHQTLADAVGAAGGGTGSAGAVAFAKMFPNRNYTQYMDSLRANSRIVRTELYRVVAVYTR
jgi:hypothetical protein